MSIYSFFFPPSFCCLSFCVFFLLGVTSVCPPTPAAVSMGIGRGDITPTSHTRGSREVRRYQATAVITAVIWNYNWAIRLMENVPISSGVLQRDTAHAWRGPPPETWSGEAVMAEAHWSSLPPALWPRRGNQEGRGLHLGRDTADSPALRHMDKSLFLVLHYLTSTH